MLNFSNYGIKSGIYSISIDGRVVYIGQSADLHSRALSHRYNILNSQELWYPLIRNFFERGHEISFSVIESVNPKNLRQKEKDYIFLYQPLFNQQLSTNNQRIPSNYLEAIQTLKLKQQPYLGIETIQKEELIKAKGWFGEINEFGANSID